MECCLSQETRIVKRMNADIESQLRRDKMKSRQELKLLLLGTGESGKSTFMKQMKIIHGSGFSPKERAYFIPFIHRNCLSSAKSLASALHELQIACQSQTLSHALFLSSFEDPGRITRLSGDCIQAIHILWKDPGTRLCYQRRSEFQLQDSAAYFLESLERITAPDYIPTEQDILRVRVPTTGVSEYFFQSDSVIFRIVDVGGQRTERRKWIHCFDSVTSVIFLAALNEFDQVLLENQNESRLEESIALFTTITSFFRNHRSSIIVFLNKQDLLEEKIQHKNFSDYYKEFDSSKDGDFFAVREFILQLYLKKLPPQTNKTVYSHFTTATDTKNIRVVFDCVKNTILKMNIQDYLVS